MRIIHVLAGGARCDDCERIRGSELGKREWRRQNVRKMCVGTQRDLYGCRTQNPCVTTAYRSTPGFGIAITARKTAFSGEGEMISCLVLDMFN